MFKPRPAQQEVLNYPGGKMGVLAVPGSGKTHTLSYLAAQLIINNIVQDGQEILIVTLVNSAVDNFNNRVANFIKDQGLVARLGYRVRTLHGLANDIIRERPSLAGVSDDFKIIDDNVSTRIVQDIADAWVRIHPDCLGIFVDPDLDQVDINKVRRELWPRLVQVIASNFIKKAKDLSLTHLDIETLVKDDLGGYPLLEMGLEVYRDYQHALNYRGALDFDDLIRLALRVLQSDPAFLERLSYRWPYILEDEAQDSSALQEKILSLIAGPNGNWVRVGDPNQAIYETFTTANPKFLRDFVDRPDVRQCELPNSGRSTRSIIKLANYMIQWVKDEHPIPQVQDALLPPYIEPSPPGDPQPNPADDIKGIALLKNKHSAQEELQRIAQNLEHWLPRHPNSTVAVLVPRNDRGEEMVKELKKRGLKYVEILQSTTSTRQTANTIATFLAYLADPGALQKLVKAFEAWQKCRLQIVEENKKYFQAAKDLLRKCPLLESFLWPVLDEQSWLYGLSQSGCDPEIFRILGLFKQAICRWQKAAALPVDQIVMTIAQDLSFQPPDLALVYKLALLLKQASTDYPQWRLDDLAQELVAIASNERKFLGFSDADSGFDPDQHAGEVVVTTMHKSKGLEWDRVYLTSVNNYDFPSGSPQDTYYSEKWFVRNHLNLEAETLSLLANLAINNRPGLFASEGDATMAARYAYISERLRLLYVGVTRAKKELFITWNSGRGSQQEAVPLVILRTFWEKYINDITG
jgi:DNA helicase II / ATP-dependent DNA helicase PcrA